MSKTEVIENNMLRPGSKFTVIDGVTDSTFGPGTTGFVAYVKGFDQDYQNVVFLECVISKRGKTGKSRMDTAQISVPIFNVDDKKFSEMMPDEKRRYYVYIKPEPVPGSLMEVDGMDFIGMSFARALFLHKLSTRANRMNVWPKSRDDMLNKFLNMNSFFDENPEEVIDRFSTEDIRMGFITKSRIIEATLLKCSLAYIAQLTRIELGAINALTKAGVGEKAQIGVTEKFVQAKNTVSGALQEVHGNSREMKRLIDKKVLIPLAKSILV